MLSLIIMKSVYSQNNNLVIYSQDGLKFTVILNGIRQNAIPQTNVKVTGLNAPNYQVKLIFENKMPDLDKNTYLTNGAETTKNTEYTYAIVNNKGKYKLKPKSIAPFEETAPAVAAADQTVVTYSPVDAVAVNTNATADNTTIGATTTTTTSTTTNTVGTTTNGASVGMNVNGVGLGININITDPSGTGTTNSNTTTTYTTTTTTTGGSMNAETTGGTSSATNVSTTNSGYVLPGYNGVYGCSAPMGDSDFADAKKSIAAKGFDDSRLTIAKQIIGSNCLLCSQIKELMELMSFEATKLDLAKFAWHHNLDKGNYYKLNDAFTFESSIDELNQYTQSH